MGAVDLDRTLARHSAKRRNRGRQTDRGLFRPTACQAGTCLPGLGDVALKTPGSTEVKPKVEVEEMGFIWIHTFYESCRNKSGPQWVSWTVQAAVFGSGATRQISI